jgi:hypothetical protein
MPTFPYRVISPVNLQASLDLPGGGRETAGLEMLLGGVSTTEVLYVLVWVMVALRGYVGSMAMAMLGNAE